ncbi:MAG TPA: hypothetical protein VF103_06015, partial [Polyangiaceae bacterium]
MKYRLHRQALRASALPLLFVAASVLFGCSGKSDSNADDEGETGGSNTGGTSGSGGSSGSATGGTGGSGEAGGSGGVPPYCETEFGPTDPTALIDDIEDGNPLIATVGGRNGSWWVTSDATVGTITPPSDAAPPPERILGKRCDSEYGMRVTGQGFTSWGANISIAFKYEAAALSIDAS